MEKEIKTCSAEEFRNKNGDYIFPFDVLDKTPGGQNIGRIMWNVEFIQKEFEGRSYIEKILIQARQTRDKRYAGKLFEIECFTESITGGYSFDTSFVSCIWKINPCEIHKTHIFSAYPKDNHSKLIVINVGSSISIDIIFK